MEGDTETSYSVFIEPEQHSLKQILDPFVHQRGAPFGLTVNNYTCWMNNQQLRALEWMFSMHHIRAGTTLTLKPAEDKKNSDNDENRKNDENADNKQDVNNQNANNYSRVIDLTAEN
ncbi:hypothetical protein VTN00DRAFT_8504 [Thermoascus crustaceus]|uniref:uncharacterized protein n=1 Tax=Thermoascus crustaceus TaxID=5088 RepID=UPI00374499E9